MGNLGEKEMADRAQINIEDKVSRNNQNENPNDQGAKGSGNNDPEFMSDEELKKKIEDEDIEFMKGYDDISIDELISKGYVEHEIKIGEKITAVIRTLTSSEDKDISKKFGDYEGNNNYITSEHTDNILSKALVSFGSKEFSSEEEARAFLGSQSVAIKTYLNQEHVGLLKAVAILLKGPGAENPLIRPLTGIGSGLG